MLRALTGRRPKCSPPRLMEKKLPAMPVSAAIVSSPPNARPRFSGSKMSATSAWQAGNTSARPTPVAAAQVTACGAQRAAGQARDRSGGHTRRAGWRGAVMDRTVQGRVGSIASGQGRAGGQATSA